MTDPGTFFRGEAATAPKVTRAAATQAGSRASLSPAPLLLSGEIFARRGCAYRSIIRHDLFVFQAIRQGRLFTIKKC